MGESQVLRARDIDWNRAIFWPADIGDPSSFMDGEVDAKSLMRMNAILISDLNALLQRIGDYGQVKAMLKAWRRIGLGILTAMLGTLIPYILTFLRLLGILP